MAGKFHYHEVKPGFMQRCYHTCRHWFSPGFLAGWLVASTITFGPEHSLWEKVWPYYLITNWLSSLPYASITISILVNIFFVFCAILGIMYKIKSKEPIDERS